MKDPLLSKSEGIDEDDGKVMASNMNKRWQSDVPLLITFFKKGERRNLFTFSEGYEHIFLSYTENYNYEQSRNQYINDDSQ